jgi:ribosomal protein S18 acetylase RimI-like enzyme
MRITGYKHREDFESVMEINDACYFGDFRPPREIMADMVSVSDVLVARAKDGDWRDPEATVIGFAIVRNAEQPYIWNIAVAPAYQGRGVAGNLLREIIRKYTLEKCSRVTLHVNAKNSAQKLYFDYGFRVVAVEKNYFNPDAGLLMERKLP